MHELGRGQFGRVWLAHWKGVEVAVKELHRGGDARACAEMLREAQTLAGLRHPCVIALFGILLDDSSVSFHASRCAEILLARCTPLFRVRPPGRVQQILQSCNRVWAFAQLCQVYAAYPSGCCCADSGKRMLDFRPNVYCHLSHQIIRNLIICIPILTC